MNPQPTLDSMDMLADCAVAGNVLSKDEQEFIDEMYLRITGGKYLRGREIERLQSIHERIQNHKTLWQQEP